MGSDEAAPRSRGPRRRPLHGSALLPSALHGLEDSAHYVVHCVAVLRLDPEGVAGQGHRTYVLRREKLACRVDEVLGVSRGQQASLWLALEREPLRPHVPADLFHQSLQQAAAAADVDVRWQHLPSCKLPQAESEAL